MVKLSLCIAGVCILRLKLEEIYSVRLDDRENSRKVTMSVRNLGVRGPWLM